jgi:predicted AAA+ superfamily ATPase
LADRTPSLIFSRVRVVSTPSFNHVRVVSTLIFDHAVVVSALIFDHAVVFFTLTFDHTMVIMKKTEESPMKRLLDYHLLQWKTNPHRKPLMLRGARQVGKTFAVRQLGLTFRTFVEVNFEFRADLKTLFTRDLDPIRIIRELSLLLQKPIVPGETLLFFDEIQECPPAIAALRYFYEIMPTLHVIGAGSLLDFSLQKIGVPVGRVSSLYMYPLSFVEYLCAIGKSLLIESLQMQDEQQPLSEAVHHTLLKNVAQYLAIGGMPDAVRTWIDMENPREIVTTHHTLLGTYRQDFLKYAKEYQIKYVEQIFNEVPRQLGGKFKYSKVEGDYRKRELSPCLDLLATAGVIHSVTHTSGQGAPIGAGSDPRRFKVIFLDSALCQTALGFDLTAWLLRPEQELVNKGAIVEAFIGQEILAYSLPIIKGTLYYWHREARGSQAEIDYLYQDEGNIIPIEVKSGSGTSLKSLHLFLEEHPQTPYGIRISTHNYSHHARIRSLPLYATLSLASLEQKEAIRWLCQTVDS